MLQSSKTNIKIMGLKIRLNLACLAFIFIIMPGSKSMAQKTPAREYYKITVYHFTDSVQENVLDDYLEHALMPALHKQKIQNVGIFKCLANDTAAQKTMYVFTHFSSLAEMHKTDVLVAKDEQYKKDGTNYINASYNQPPYSRMETIITYAFPLAPHMQLPALQAAKNERVYELRSYESATEKIFQNKVQMFNEGGEITLFKRLNFNAVFYSEVIAGSKMPNLMYMTTFENMQDRDAHWKSFVDAPEWKRLVAMPEYQNNMQHIDIIFLRPTNYSDF